MDSITDDPNSFFDNLTKAPEPKAPEKKVEQPEEKKEETKAPSVTEDPSAFFDSLTPKPQEQEKPVSAVDQFATATQGLEPENFDKDYLGMMSTWSPQEWHDFKKIRPDYPIPADKQREVFDAERAGLIKKEQSGGSLWDETKRLLRGAGKFAGQMFEEPAEDASEEDIKAHAVNTLNALKSFNAPVMELPGELATTAAKIGLGGTKYTDQLSEKYGFSTPEDSFRRYQARESVDTANALLNRTSPTVYSKMLFHPYVQEGLKSLIKLNAPGIDDETAYKGAQEVAQDVAKSQAPIDEDIKTAGSWLSPAGLGFGEMGFAGNVIGAGAGIPGLVRGLSMSKAAQQALEQAATAARVEKASKIGLLGSAAKKFADTTEGLQQAAAEFAQNRPILAAVGTAALKDLPGAVIGYGEDKEHPLRGALLGAIVEHTALGALGKLKGLEAVTQIPRTLADLAEAKAVSAGGRKGMFELAGANPEASQLTQTLFKNGKIYDKLGNLIKDYGREGVNMGALGVATGALNSQDADELADSLKSGIGFGVFAKALHGALRQDPSAHQREIRQTDADIYKTMQQLSPETQENIRQLQDWTNVVRTHPELANADVATRQAYAREIGKMINTMHETTNGPFRAGQKNIGVEILSTPQIVDRMVAQNPDKTPAELQQIAETGAGLYFPTGGREFVPGESVPTALQAPMTRVTFDPMKPTAVVNIDKVADFAKAQNVSFADALRHEFGHALDDIPEFRELNAQTDKLLFDFEDRGLDGKVYQSTKGLFSNKDLVDRFFNEYLSGEGDKAAKEQWAKGNQLWDTVNDRPNEKAIVDYMKKEVRADLNASSFTGHNLKSLDSVQQHLLDWATLNRQNSIVARAVDKYMGNGGRDPFAATPSVATGAQFTPEVLSAHRNAVRQLQKLNGMISTPTAGESVAPMITKAKLIGNKALRERYGRDSGLFKTEFRATVFDANGNVVGQTVLTDPMAKEGLWGNENGTLNQRSGYGEAPAGVQVPEGGSLKVSREIVMGPDGETPQMLSPKEIKQLVKTRADLIRDALDTAYQGEPEGFRPVSEDRLSYRGTFTPAQIAAIRALPEQIVPAKVKESILRFNDLLARGDGNRMLIDYAARVDDRGKAVSFSPKIYDLVPIGMHFSKDGNFLITTVSVTRLLNKLDLWADRLPGRLAPWGGNREAFFREFAGKYLQNHLTGKPGETGLDPDPKVALEKKNIFNDFLNLTNNDARSANPDRTVIPRKKGDPKGKYADRTIMSVRADSIADMLESTAPPLPVDYGKQLMNFLPAREGKATEEPNEENNPILKALNAVKATYVAPDQRTPYAQPAKNANQDVQRISEDYVKNAGMEYRPHGQAVPVNEELAKRIADHYEEAKNDPSHPEVKKAYTALANEVVDQWKAFEKAGYTATPWTGEGQPYANSAEMMKDVRDNKHLYYFQTKEGYGESGITDKMRAENPMLQDSGVNFNGAENVPVNDVFRVVHDIVGHGANGYEFGPRGEFNAYLEHSRMFSDAAKPALAGETLAQNSWVNFGPHLRDEEGNIAKKGEKGYVPVTERPFAEQKNIALPQEFIDAAEKEAQAGTKSGPSFLPAKKLTVQHPSKEKEGSVGGELDLVHFGAHGLKSADPSKFGKGAATPGDLRGAPKTYFYLNNDRNYEGIMRGRTPYVAKVDGNSIYDLEKDPLGVAGMLNREKMDNMIEDAGYAGYFSPKSYNGAFDAVAMFKKTKLTEVQQGREIFKTPKTSKYFGVNYLPAEKGVDEGTQTNESLSTDEQQTESDTQAERAGIQAGGQSQDDRNRLLGGFASVARGAQGSGAEGVQGASGSASRKEVEETALRRHAEENGLMRDPEPFHKQWQLDGSEAGGEHQVSFPPGPDVVKRTPNPYYPTWADYFDSLQIHNTLFPKAALTFRGLQNVEGSGGVDIDGNKWPAGLYSEVSQPFLKIKRGLSVPETDAMMKEIGFRRTLPMEYVNDDLGIKIKDLHGMNAVMLEDENGHEFPYVIDSTIVPTKAKEEQPRVRLDGHVVVTNPEADFVAKPKILVNFLPASQRINLEDYADRPMFALPADRMGVGTKYVGPTGDKKKLSVEAQGGPEHMTLLNNGVWAFTNDGPASTFVNRVNKLAEKHGTDSVLVAVTLQSPINHLKNPTGQLGYVEAMEQARDTKHVTQKQLDAQIKEMSSAIVNSTKKDMDENVRAKWKQITSFSKFADAVRGKKLNFGDMEPFLGQMQRSKLPISSKELAAMGLLPHDIARDLSTDWIFDLPNDTVVGLFEVKKGTRPTQDNTHYSYPWSVAGKPIGFLKDIYHVKGLTTHEGIQKSTSLAWPLQRALPELDNLKKALADLPPVVTYR